MGIPVADRNTALDTQIPNATTFYIALFTVAPNDEGVGGTEVSGGSYARASSANWPAASGGVKTNGADLVFATATADWGTIVAVAWMSALTGGTQEAVSDNTISQAISSGVTLTIEAGELDLTLS